MRQNRQASKAPTPSYGSQEEHSFCQKKLSTKSLASLERAVTADNGGQRLRFLADIAGFIQIKFTYLQFKRNRKYWGKFVGIGTDFRSVLYG